MLMKKVSHSLLLLSEQADDGLFVESQAMIMPDMLHGCPV